MMNRVLLLFVLLASLFVCQVHTACSAYTTVTPFVPPTATNKSFTNTFKIGLVGSFSTPPDIVSMLKFAAYFINNATDILPDVNLELSYAELSNSNTNALLAAQHLIQTEGVGAIIGGISSTETRIMQLVAKIYEVPQIAPNVVSSILSNKEEYPFLARMVAPDSYLAMGMITLIQMHNWKQVLLIYADNEYGLGGYQSLQASSLGTNITFFTLQIPNTGRNAADFAGKIETAQQLIDDNRLRIIIMYTNYPEGIAFWRLLNATGYTGPNFVYMLPTTFGPLLGSPALLRAAPFVYGSLMFNSRYGTGSLYRRARAAWGAVNTTTFVGTRPDPTYLWYYFDAIYSIAHSIQKLLAGGVPFANIKSSRLYDTLKYNISDHSGVTGPLLFDASADRLGTFLIRTLNASSTLSSEANAEFSTQTKNITMISPFVFASGGTVIPNDGICLCKYGTCTFEGSCICAPGYTGDDCSTFVTPESTIVNTGGFTTDHIVMVIVIPVVFMGIVGVILGLWLKKKRRIMIKDVAGRQRSIISRADIILQERIGRGASGEVFKGKLRGTDVAVKKIVASSASKALVESFQLESAIMAGLRHPNIVLFMGSCFEEKDREMLLVMEFMDKGSLHDVIHDSKTPLPMELALHIAVQAAKGMNFLHQSSPPILHRDIKSHNILLDDKWNSRISDFGLTRIKDLNKKNADTKQDDSLGTVYWTAPEVFDGKGHSEASDCYSFGIVLWELFHRQTPYNNRDPMAVALDVSRSALRPTLKLDLNDDIKKLITDCWAQDPLQRPSFEEIVQRLRKLTMQYPMYSFSGGNGAAEAPSGTVFLVQTEIESSNELWDKVPCEMHESIVLHNKLVRASLESYNGYEVDFISDGFSLAFSTVQDAVNWSISLQVSMLHLDWPAELLAQPPAGVVKQGGDTIFAGLRVRMSIHTGVPNCSHDNSGRMKYMGPVVQKTRQLLSSTKKGSVIVSAPVHDSINKTGRTSFVEAITARSCGEILNSARNKLETIYTIYPSSLLKRDQQSQAFSSANELTDHPHTVIVDYEEYTENGAGTAIPKQADVQLPWIIPAVDINMRETIGMGGTAEFRKAIWKDKEVAVRLLRNQRLGESDLLSLKANCSLISKLKHPNLVEFYGVCFDSSNVSIVTEYLPKSNLREILSDLSFVLTFTQKLKVARGVAQGLEYLSSQENSNISIHRSLKSTNIHITKDWDAKIADYGQGDLKDLARTMTVVTTIASTAPEMLRGEDPTEKSSTYSFGMLLWELYTRQVPYAGEHPIKCVAKILDGFRPSVPSECPVLFKQMIEQCLHDNPTNRPSWKTILTDIEFLLTQEK